MASRQLIAIVRPVPDTITECELTHLHRSPIDVGTARRQHARYEDALAAIGCHVHRLPTLHMHPDSVFVEDTVLVLPEVAIALRPGAESRRGEVESTIDFIQMHRPVHTIESPGTLDGGDILTIGRRVFIGLSSRSDTNAVHQLQDLLRPWNYTVHAVPVSDCLHLKSAVTVIDEEAVLCNPAWVDAQRFEADTVIECDPNEPDGANVLRASGQLVAGRFPRTNRKLRNAGYRVHELDLGELAKAEGAVTCCSIIFEC